MLLAERGGDMSGKKKYIHFINSDYKTLFYLPDEGRIRITYSKERQVDRVCRFVDEYHTVIGGDLYHICEFAERMEKIGAKYEPLDYIKEPEFYTKMYMTSAAGIELPAVVKAPAYYVIDETDEHSYAFAPKGAPKGLRYCIFQKLPDEYRRDSYKIGEIFIWSGNLKGISPQDYGFNIAKIKAATQRPKARDQPQR